MLANAEPFRGLDLSHGARAGQNRLQRKAIMKLLPLLTASCLCAVAYTSSALAAETAADSATEATDPAVSGILPSDASGGGQASDPEADTDVQAEESSPAAKEREAKNAIYLDLLGPGLLYSINYDRMLTDEFSARIGFSYFGVGASASDASGNTTASASFSYWAVPLTVSYLGIGSDTNMLELGGGASILNFSGSGLIESDDEEVGAGASVTTVSATAMVGYRRQPADGGFVFRVGLSPVMTFGAGFLPWGYLSLGAAF
jgi:hypothetical protein